MAKISLDSIREELEQDGWKVISDTYTNLETEMRFECPEGHAVFAPWKKLRAKRICPTCEANIYKTEAATSKIVPKKKNVFRVLALDQATHITGFSIFDDKELAKRLSANARCRAAADHDKKNAQITKELYETIMQKKTV